MQNAKDISFIEYVDRLLFGPTVAFEKVSAYGLEETIDRLEAARLPFLHQFLPFSTGLIGSVSVRRVSLGWRNEWTGHGIQPVFRGTIRSSGSMVIVVGNIGVPWYVKAFILVWWIFWLTILGILYKSGAFRGQAPNMLLLFIAMPVGVFSLLIALNRFFKVGDYKLIADSIDAALS